MIQNFNREKPLFIRYNKIDGFIEIYNKTRYLVLFDEWCKKICDKIKYVIREKSGITDSFNRSFGKITIDSYYSLPIEKILTFQNVMILTKSVVSKNKNHYCNNIFLEKGSDKDKFNTEFFE